MLISGDKSLENSLILCQFTKNNSSMSTPRGYEDFNYEIFSKLYSIKNVFPFSSVRKQSVATITFMPLYYLVLCVNLAQARIIKEEGASVEEMPLLGPGVRHFLNGGGPSPWSVVPSLN